MKFDSKKGMDNLYTRLVAFRNFVRLMASTTYHNANHISNEGELKVLDDLIYNLSIHNSKVFDDEFLDEGLEMEDILESIPENESEEEINE